MQRAQYTKEVENLEVKKVYVDELPKDERICSNYGKVMQPFGEKVIRDEFIYKPAELYRQQTIVKTYKCTDSDKEDSNLIVSDHYSLIPRLIPESSASSGLVAHVMYYKYMMAMPLYRQEQNFLRLGAKVSRATMSHWIITCSQTYLTPVWDHMKKNLLEREFLMADETPVQVLKEPGRRQQSRSYVWMVRTGNDSGHPIILYRYTETRKGDNAREFFKDAIGSFYLMTKGCRPYLKNYLKDGGCSFDNNWSENAIRPVVMGRKNRLFSDTPEGATAGMIG